jgi:NAD(P)-dependent dehydrogenase (short-subunit alcohol dehydrogenase family)
VGGAVEDVTIEGAKALFETNIFGVLRVCRAALPALRMNCGYIIKISGLANVVGLPFAAHHSASKFAVEGLSESVRLEARFFGASGVARARIFSQEPQIKTPHRRRFAKQCLRLRLRLVRDFFKVTDRVYEGEVVLVIART